MIQCVWECMPVFKSSLWMTLNVFIIKFISIFLLWRNNSDRSKWSHFDIHTYRTWILSVCLSVCSHFSQLPKVPGSWNFASRRHLGQLKTWRSPIKKIFLTDSRGMFRFFLTRIIFISIIFVHNLLSHQKIIVSWNFGSKPPPPPPLWTNIMQTNILDLNIQLEM